MATMTILRCAVFMLSIALAADSVARAGDLFERSDAYSIYLRDPRLTEDTVREANGWAAKAAVPLWIAMPAH